MYHVMNPNEAKVYSIETFSDDSTMLESYMRGVLKAGYVPLVERHDLGVTVVSRVCDFSREQLIKSGSVTVECQQDDLTREADILSRMAQFTMVAGN